MATQKHNLIGGSFAPPLSDAILASYRQQIEALPERSQLREALAVLHNCAAQWWEQPDSTGDGKPHLTGRAIVVPLDTAIAEALWDHIPWDDELEIFAKLFDAISNETDKPLRDLAHHLLWHAVELALDREPLTADKVRA